MSSFFFPLLLLLASAPPHEAGAIIENSVEANAIDFKAQQDYSYLATEKEDGGPRKSYEVSMMLGSPYRRLVAIGGHPLDTAAQRRELEKMQKTLAERKRESQDERAERISKYLDEKQQENLMLAEMTKAFKFRLVGTEDMHGHEVYVFDASRNPDYKPINSKAKVLTGMRGKLWVDAKTYHWVKVEAEVVNPVYFEGFLARVDPGTKFVLDKGPVGDNIWLPTRFSVQVNSKILGLFSHNSSEQDTFSNYQKSSEVAQQRQ
jgi:hypothetical protein